MPYSESDWQPFVPIEAMRYAPELPADSIVRRYRIRPRRVFVRPWVMPEAVETGSGLWKPKTRYKHPRVWGWLLAATAQDVERADLVLGGFYHFKRFSDEWLGDDAKPDDTLFTFDELPVAMMHLDNVLLELTDCPIPLPVSTVAASLHPVGRGILSA